MSSTDNLVDIKPNTYYKGEEILPLTADEVIKRQRLYGKNIIEKHTARSWYIILLRSVLDPFSLLLLVLSCLSLFLDDLQAFVIMIITAISAAIRYVQEKQSETKLNDLTSINMKKKVTVIRRNLLFEYEEIVDLSDCVPGDFIKLTAGERVPADIQLIKANSLFVDQSILTGESLPCLKYVKELSNVTINYDIVDETLVRFAKKKNLLDKIKRIFFSFLKDNCGLDTQYNNIKFDNKVLNQFDKVDLCFMSTSIVAGNGIGVVLATGQKTFFGAMSEQLSFHRPITSFNKGIKQISVVFIALMLVVITIPILLIEVFGLNLFGMKESSNERERWIYGLQFALSVAVGLTPELLPVIYNANLAKGTISLSKNCIVKRMESITNLGSMNILCTDKTGTLTENFAQLCNTFNFKKQYCLIGLELAYLNSSNQNAFKNLTDQAIINAYEDKLKQTKLEAEAKSKIQIQKIEEIPFDFKRRKVTVVYELADINCRILITKGAVNEMLDVCSFYLDQESNKDSDVLLLKNLFKFLKEARTDGAEENSGFKIRKMTSEISMQLRTFNTNLNHEGYRVLAVAYQIEDLKPNSNDPNLNTSKKSNLTENDLVFVSFLTFLNPPKRSAAKAIKDLISNNVKIKVLTGDTQEVCRNVCKQIGLSTNLIINSKQLNALNEEEMKMAAIKNVIFATLTPFQKYEIVRLLRAQGHVVGFLGDGINDVLALKEADVGLSVDDSTEIAKDAADIILLEKELDVINVGLFHGRMAFLNTIKYISMALSSNFGNVLSIFISCVGLPFLPIAPLQILLQNLLYDFSQVVLPFDNIDDGDLRKPEVFRMKNLIYFSLFWGPVSTFYDLLTFAFLYFFYNIKTEDDNVQMFQTGWFCVGLLSQTLVVHVLRTYKLPIIQSNASFKVYLSTGTSLVIGLILPFTPLGNLFDMVRLPIGFYYFLVFLLFSYCLSVQLLKKLYLRLFKTWFTDI